MSQPSMPFGWGNELAPGDGCCRKKKKEKITEGEGGKKKMERKEKPVKGIRFCSRGRLTFRRSANHSGVNVDSNNAAWIDLFFRFGL